MRRKGNCCDNAVAYFFKKLLNTSSYIGLNSHPTINYMSPLMIILRDDLFRFFSEISYGIMVRVF